MPRTKRPRASGASTSSSQYKRLDELTAEERKQYDSILEDFDRQRE